MNQNPTRRPSYSSVNIIVLSRMSKFALHVKSGQTHSLSRTSTNGHSNPMAMMKLMILATSVSNPARISTPPNMVEPMYPAMRMRVGTPPSTCVAPPRSGSMHTRTTVPPVRMAWGDSELRNGRRARRLERTAVMWHSSCQPMVKSFKGLMSTRTPGMFQKANMTTA